MSHTPGPWRPVSNVFTYDVFGPEGDLIAHVFSPADPDVTAGVNANLIAEAPNLLAMLKAMTEIVFVLDEANQLRREVTSAWDLIAKAESRDQ